jgi:D-lactate dehydrogenase
MTNARIKVGVFSTQNHDRQYLKLLSEKFEVHFFEAHLNQQTALLAQGCKVACLFVNDCADRPALQALAQAGVKLIALRCAGYNNVDLLAAKELGLTVVRVPEYSPHAVAEFAMSLLMTLNRKTHKAYARTRELNFQLDGLMGVDLYKKTMGIVGTGRIGSVLAKIAIGFDMNVLACDAMPDAELQNLGVRYVDMSELCKTSDFISLHVPLNAKTYHIVNSKMLNIMKPSCLLINTGRGGLIDSQALLEALKNKALGGAALDVYEEEDGVFYENFESEGITDDTLARLLTFPNVLISSHQGFFTHEALSAIANTTYENLVSYFSEKPINTITIL